MTRAAALAALVLALATPAFGAARGVAEVEVLFTPGDDVEGLLVQRIAGARDSVYVQAYLFTDRRIARALLDALHRGVQVEVIGDARQAADGGLPWLRALARAGARVYLDATARASHNKIVILDGDRPEAAVVTGSYNFTRSAQSRNAENVVVISANRTVTDRYVANFRARRAQAAPWR
ncbi:MAG TPA: phospholipase D-like domain-containing protein [Usitatibacter sp.]|nr:phospholipase D-like domain-containing protein [Usitatibacter sp.]